MHNFTACHHDRSRRDGRMSFIVCECTVTKNSMKIRGHTPHAYIGYAVGVASRLATVIKVATHHRTQYLSPKV